MRYLDTVFRISVSDDMEGQSIRSTAFNLACDHLKLDLFNL
jgi:hypothetical protein